MYCNGLNLVPYPKLNAGEQVPVERMHPTRPEESDKVKCPAILPQAGAELNEGRELIEEASLNALGDAN